MADIISLDDKLELSREKKADRRRRQKAAAVRRAMQCTGCARKCEKCGAQVERPPAATDERRFPYRFCEACAEEYGDYLERLQGRGDPDCYWHNEAWLDTWRKWIDYQGSVDRYRRSREFIRLLREFETPGPEA